MTRYVNLNDLLAEVATIPADDPEPWRRLHAIALIAEWIAWRAGLHERASTTVSAQNLRSMTWKLDTRVDAHAKLVAEGR